MDIHSTNTEWAWPWRTVLVSISLINLVICAILYTRSMNNSSRGEHVYRKRLRIMGLS